MFAPGETMESVGEKLRQQRVRQGLTLDDVCASTRISVKNLEAIESDELSRISSAFFYRSFVRQFAQRLALNYDDLAAAVQNWANTMPEPAMPGQLQAAMPKVPPLQSTRPKSFRWLFSFIALIAVLTGCSSLYGMWQSSRYNLQASVVSFVNSLTGNPKRRMPGTAVVSRERASSEVRLATAPHRAAALPLVTRSREKSALSDGPAEPVTAATLGGESASGFRVEVAAVESTWISITTDNKEIYSGVLEAAETKSLEGHDSARIRAGNAGGVNVLFNGKMIGSLGPRGQVRTVLFTKDNYEIVEPPAHIALTSFSPSGE
ncbi:MAG: helix-turn-helix domain-containing protein [Bryobacteraceae bacterium]